MITMTVAQPDDLPSVLEILAETSAWLVSRGIHQWPSPLPRLVHELMAREIEAGEVYLAHLPTPLAPVGMLCFEWRDEGLRPEDAGEAGYVHSLAVRPGFHGRRVSQVMLAWAATHVGARQRRYLRLDCVADNQVLRNYYERLGFAICGSTTDGDALYQLDLTGPTDRLQKEYD